MSNTETLIIITPDVALSTATATESARLIRDQLLAEASTISTIADDLDRDAATETLKSLKRYKDMIEVQREAAKAPVLTMSRAIDALAKDLSGQVTFSYDRITRVLGEYEYEQRRKREDARRVAEAEAARIAYEAQREADAVHAAASKLIQSTAVATEVAAKVEAIEQQAVSAMIEVRQAAHNVAPKVAGTALRSTPNYEVEDIVALYAAHPTLCTISDNRRAILAVLKDNPNLKIPGIRHWQDAKVTLR